VYDLNGKVALVTGAGGERGIGRAIAVRMAEEGVDVAVNDVETAAHGSAGASWRGVDSVVDEVRRLGRDAMGALADVSDASQVEAMVLQVMDRFGRIDILVNNAASRPGRDRVAVVDLEEDDWDRVQRVNAKGTFLCSRSVARLMVTRGEGGKIINISSSTGKQGIAFFAAYSASKAAVIGFTQSLALELAPHGINVNAVCPGMVDTDRIGQIAAALRPEGVGAEEHHEQILKERAERVPLGRVARAADIATMVAFLASKESDYLTGLAVNVSGGMDMR
jgi:NAD(P)-dependent dehydrogenase (short-subunit alcohol dehydrogenase family)